MNRSIGMLTRAALLPILVLLLFPAGATAEQAPDHDAVTPAPRDDQDWWLKRHQSINARVQEGDVDLIFVGDSITQGWEGPGKAVWARCYAHRNAANLGISGDRTQHVLWRLEHGNVQGISPELAVVMIGTNNYQDNTTPEITDGIVAVVQSLREKLPETKVLLLAIFPRKREPGPVRHKLDAASAEAAERVANDRQVAYRDIGDRFLDAAGMLPENIMPDFLHPNEQGYRIWARAIEPGVAAVLRDTTLDTPPAHFTPLFNGKDLTGWTPVGGGAEAWGVEDGLLYTTGSEGGGWLSTEKTYGDFELELEFKVPQGGNSGVFLRAPREGNPAFAGLEVQVLDDFADKYTELKPWQFCGSVYSVAAPARRVTRSAGDWQHMRIRCEGPAVSVTLNGHPIVQTDLTEHEDKLEEHPGLARHEGYIGLQNHGSRVEFRRIWIRPLQVQ